MRNEFIDSIENARGYISKIDDPLHDSVHVRGVVELVEELAGHSSNKDLIKVAAWWHDVGRLWQKNHEKLSARMASDDLEGRGVGEEKCRKVYRAIIFHR